MGNKLYLAHGLKNIYTHTNLNSLLASPLRDSQRTPFSGSGCHSLETTFLFRNKTPSATNGTITAANTQSHTLVLLICFSGGALSDL